MNGSLASSSLVPTTGTEMHVGMCNCVVRAPRELVRLGVWGCRLGVWGS